MQSTRQPSTSGPPGKRQAAGVWACNPRARAGVAAEPPAHIPRGCLESDCPQPSGLSRPVEELVANTHGGVILTDRLTGDGFPRRLERRANHTAKSSRESSTAAENSHSRIRLGSGAGVRPQPHTKYRIHQRTPVAWVYPRYRLSWRLPGSGAYLWPFLVFWSIRAAQRRSSPRS